MSSGNALLTNTPNFLGMLFNSNVRKTQFLTAIGGTDGGNAVITTNPEFPLSVTYAITNPAQPAITENQAVGSASPTYFGLTQGKNVIQIFTEDVTVSALRERASGRLSGINTAGQFPEESSELALQVKLHLEKMKRDMNYTAINGAFEDGGLTNSTVALKTRGILAGITTNSLTPEIGTASDYVNAISSLIKAVYDNGMFDTPTLVVNSTEKINISKNFVLTSLTAVDQDRFTAGVGVDEVVTDFGKSVYVIVDNDVPDKTILLADLAYVRPVFTRDVETGEIIAIKPAPQRNGQAVNIYAEFGLDYGAEFNHGKIVYTIPEEENGGNGETPVVVDKTALNALITTCDEIVKGDYTDETWTPFTTSLASAKVVQANDEATQAEVDGAVSDLTAKKNALSTE